MKRSAITFSIILVALAGAGFALRAWRNVSTSHEAADDPRGILGVEEFMRRPEDHPGRVRVKGVVSSVEAESRLVTLVDQKEWEECGQVNCAPLSLPVRWVGAMPRVEEGVAVSGRVEEQAGKLVLVAEAVERVPQARTDAR